MHSFLKEEKMKMKKSVSKILYKKYHRAVFDNYSIPTLFISKRRENHFCGLLLKSRHWFIDSKCPRDPSTM